MTALGPIVFSFFERHLKADKGMSPASIKSYRDAVKLFLAFVASERRRMITSLSAEDLTAERVREFLSHLEIKRGNHIRTRNQRLAGLHAFFNYLAGQAPEMLAEAQKVAAIPRKNHRHPVPLILNVMNSRHCSPDFRFAEGPRYGTVLCCSSCTTLELAFKRQRILRSTIWCSSHSRVLSYMERETNGEPVRCGQKLHGCFVRCLTGELPVQSLRLQMAVL